MRLDDPRLADARRRRPRGPVGGRLVRRGVGATTGCSSPRPCSRTARSATSTASCSCRPTACSTSGGSSPPGDLLRAVPSRLGVGLGHRRLRGLLAPAGAPAARPRRRPDPHQRVVVAGARPRRDERGRPRDGDVVADADADLRPADDVVRRVLQPGRRRRVDLVLGRLRGHRPDRRARSSARRSSTRACSWSTSTSPTSAASGSRCRCCATSGPSSRSASSTGSSPSGPAWPTDSTAEERCRAAGSTSTPTDRRRVRRRDQRRRSSCPTELAIDTDVARRVIGEFIRGQLRQAGFERARPRAVGRDRLGARRVPRRRGDRRRAAAVRADAVPDLVAGLAGRRRGGRPAARLRLGARRHQPDGRRLLRDRCRRRRARPDGLEATALRRGNFMARMRMAVLYDRSVTWRGLVVGTGNKTESLIGYTTLFGDNASRVQPDRRPVQEPGPPAGRRRSACPTRSSRKAPSADLWPGQTDESEAGFSYPELDRLLFWRVDKRRSPDELVAMGFAAERGRPGRPGPSRRPSSSARSRRSPSSVRGRPASTTSTRAGGRARPSRDRGRVGPPVP